MVDKTSTPGNDEAGSQLEFSVDDERLAAEAVRLSDDLVPSVSSLFNNDSTLVLMYAERIRGERSNAVLESEFRTRVATEADVTQLLVNAANPNTAKGKHYAAVTAQRERLYALANRFTQRARSELTALSDQPMEDAKDEFNTGEILKRAAISIDGLCRRLHILHPDEEMQTPFTTRLAKIQERVEKTHTVTEEDAQFTLWLRKVALVNASRKALYWSNKAEKIKSAWDRPHRGSSAGTKEMRDKANFEDTTRR